MRQAAKGPAGCACVEARGNQCLMPICRATHYMILESNARERSLPYEKEF